MIRERASAAARGFTAGQRHSGTASNAGDILQRIAELVGEIDALKRERHAAPVLGARAKLAAAYFRKRRDTAPARA